MRYRCSSNRWGSDDEIGTSLFPINCVGYSPSRGHPDIDLISIFDTCYRYLIPLPHICYQDMTPIPDTWYRYTIFETDDCHRYRMSAPDSIHLIQSIWDQWSSTVGAKREEKFLIPIARSAKRKIVCTTSARLPEAQYFTLPRRPSRLSQNILYYLRAPLGERSPFSHEDRARGMPRTLVPSSVRGKSEARQAPHFLKLWPCVPGISSNSQYESHHKNKPLRTLKLKLFRKKTTHELLSLSLFRKQKSTEMAHFQSPVDINMSRWHVF